MQKIILKKVLSARWQPRKQAVEERGRWKGGAEVAGCATRQAAAAAAMARGTGPTFL